MASLALAVETEREDDGRWIAEVPDLPGAMAYGTTRDEAVAKTEALALRVLAERQENGETVPEPRNGKPVPSVGYRLASANVPSVKSNDSHGRGITVCVLSPMV